MKIKLTNIIECNEWDELVMKTYGRHYCFQQQEGCRERGLFKFAVPNEETNDFENDTIPEVINHDEMGVSFKAWLARDPKAPLKGDECNKMCNMQWSIDLWWKRNFYPDFQTVANDLYKRGLLSAGKYGINIDW